jgi:hypothetical protein
MLRGSRSIAVLLASALLAGPATLPAWADPKQVSQKDRQVASDLVKKAIARGEAGDHTGAIKLYNDAYLLVPNSLLLSNIGAQYQELHQYEDALEYFCRYLKEDPSGTNAPYAKSQARILQRQLGRKKVDGRDPCASPPPPPDGDGPDDGPGPKRGKGPEDKGKGPEDKGPGDKGKGPGDKGKGPDGATIEDRPAPAPARAGGSSSAMMYTGLAAGIAGIAAGGLGIYFGVKGKNISDQINTHKPSDPWPDNIRDLMKEGERDNNLQLGFLVASGVLVTTGVVLYVVGRPDGASEHATDKTVHVTPTANGFAVFGRF